MDVQAYVLSRRACACAVEVLLLCSPDVITPVLITTSAFAFAFAVVRFSSCSFLERLCSKAALVTRTSRRDRTSAGVETYAPLISARLLPGVPILPRFRNILPRVVEFFLPCTDSAHQLPTRTSHASTMVLVTSRVGISANTKGVAPLFRRDIPRVPLHAPSQSLATTDTTFRRKSLSFSRRTFVGAFTAQLYTLPAHVSRK